MAATKGFAPARTEDEAAAELVKVMPAKHALAKQFDRLQKLRDDLLERSLSVVDASVRFAEIEPDATEPPQAWVDELGPVGAMNRLRVAKASHASAKDAPVGIKVAAQVAVGILKANAAEKQGPRVLNVAVVQMTAPLPQFEEREIEVGK